MAGVERWITVKGKRVKLAPGVHIKGRSKLTEEQAEAAAGLSHVVLQTQAENARHRLEDARAATALAEMKVIKAQAEVEEARTREKEMQDDLSAATAKADEAWAALVH
jgi:predicted  nucleic acid-binding Zn-ribbon protein